MVAQVNGEPGGGPLTVSRVVNPGAGFNSTGGLGASESRARCWSNWVFVAPTVMAMERTSLTSSSVAPKSLATARQ